MIHYNKIDSDIKIILKFKKHVILDVIGSDLKVVMIYVMYVWSLAYTYACLIIKYIVKIIFMCWNIWYASSEILVE